MKILHVTQGYFPAIGGTEFLIQKISEELTRQFNDEVTVFTTNCYSGEAFYTPTLPRMQTGWEELNGVKIQRFPVRAWISQLIRNPQVLQVIQKRIPVCSHRLSSFDCSANKPSEATAFLSLISTPPPACI